MLLAVDMYSHVKDHRKQGLNEHNMKKKQEELDLEATYFTRLLEKKAQKRRNNIIPRYRWMKRMSTYNRSGQSCSQFEKAQES